MYLNRGKHTEQEISLQRTDLRLKTPGDICHSLTDSATSTEGNLGYLRWENSEMYPLMGCEAAGSPARTHKKAKG